MLSSTEFTPSCSIDWNNVPSATAVPVMVNVGNSNGAIVLIFNLFMIHNALMSVGLFTPKTRCLRVLMQFLGTDKRSSE